MSERIVDDEMEYLLNSHINKNQICMISSLSALCRKAGKKYDYLYFTCWPFCYMKSKDTDIGSKIEYYNPKRMNQILQNYIGFDVQFYECSCEEGLDYIRRAIEESKSVVIGMDSYYCWWNIAFQNKHIRHFFIVEQIDVENSQLICSDPFFSSDAEYKLAMDCFDKGFQNVRIVENRKLYKEMSLYEICGMLLNGSNELNAVFQDFIIDIQNVNDFNKMFDSSQVETCTLIRRIRETSEGRYGIAYILKKHDEISEEKIFNRAADCFLELGEMWKNLNMILMKLLLSGKLRDKYMKVILKDIRMIAEKEVLCCNTIKELQER